MILNAFKTVVSIILVFALVGCSVSTQSVSAVERSAPTGASAVSQTGSAGQQKIQNESKSKSQQESQQQKQQQQKQQQQKPQQQEPQQQKPQQPDKQNGKSAKAAYPDLGIEHIVIVIEENHSYKQIVGSKKAPYINQLIATGALFTNSHGVTHPSQPNYLALFSGSTQGVKDDKCLKPFKAPNLASELIAKKLSFVGYSEDLPKAGYTGCSSKGYARKHNPWVQFTNVPAESNQPLTAYPKDLSELPTVSFVIPNHQNDMHDGTIEQADTWLKKHLDAYVKWAETHNSLLIVTWDEDDFSKENHIPTLFVGPMVKAGKYDENITHYNVLRTIEDLYQLPLLGKSATADSINSVWKK